MYGCKLHQRNELQTSVMERVDYRHLTVGVASTLCQHKHKELTAVGFRKYRHEPDTWTAVT